MKIKYNIQLLLLISVVMSMGLATTSCKKEVSLDSGKVELLSFGPSGVKHGDQIVFIGKNLDKVLTVRFIGDSVISSSFVQQSSETITLTVPQKAERGVVTLRTTEGNIVSKTQFDLLVQVTISSMTAAARPGDNITITGTYMNWISEVWFSKDLLVTEFVSKSLTQLVVKVPEAAKTGPVVINTKGVKPLSITSDKDLNVTLPAITGFAPIPVERGANLTITGTNLDLTKQVLMKGVTNPITAFVSKTATQLVVKVPETATKGVITLVAYSMVTVDSPQKMLIVGDLPDLAPLGFAIYEDSYVNGWADWGWGGPRDPSNTEFVRDGDKSLRFMCDGSWGAAALHGSAATANFTEFTFSIYGGPGTNGKKLKVMANWGAGYEIPIEEGKWVEYKLPKAALGNPGTLNDLIFQEEGWAGKIWLDHIGLR